MQMRSLDSSLLLSYRVDLYIIIWRCAYCLFMQLRKIAAKRTVDLTSGSPFVLIASSITHSFVSCSSGVPTFSLVPATILNVQYSCALELAYHLNGLFNASWYIRYVLFISLKT